MTLAFSAALGLSRPVTKHAITGANTHVTVSPRPFRWPVAPRRPSFQRFPTCAAASSPSPSPQTVPTASSTAGLVRVTPSENVAVGDTLVIEYSPPPKLFGEDDGQGGKGSSTIFWAGGFRGWTGSEADADDTLMFPMLQTADRSSSEFGHYVSVAVPEYATDVQFGFCDSSGISWDLNDGELFRVPVKYQKREGTDGKIVEFVAGEDGSGDSDDDGTELGQDGANQFDADLARESASDPVISAEEEETLHRVRGEATFAGEEAGVGSVFVSQVRDVFSRYDVEQKGCIPVSKVGEVFVELSFDLDEERIAELVEKYVGQDQSAGEGTCSMTEFMLMYCELELADEGLQIV